MRRWPSNWQVTAQATPLRRAWLTFVQTSCLTEIFFVEAMERARVLDQHLADTGEVVGPLHGLPVSLKVHISTRMALDQGKLTGQDCFAVAGQYATAGYVEYLKRPIPTDNSALANLLLDAGAVLYCKTNIPQTMMVSAMF